MDVECVQFGQISLKNRLEFSTCTGRAQRSQLSFEDFFFPFGGKLSGDNRWIKLAELVPWDDLEEDYASQFCKGLPSG